MSWSYFKSSESAPQIRLQDRKKYITGKNLGTRYTEDFLLKAKASDHASAARKSLKDVEQQIKNVNEQIHFTGQYLAYKNVYADTGTI